MNSTITEQIIDQLFYSDEWSYNTIFSVLGSISSFLVFLKTYKTHYMYRYITDRKRLRDQQKREQQKEAMFQLMSQLMEAENRLISTEQNRASDTPPEDLRMRIARRKRSVVAGNDSDGDVDAV